MCTSHILLLTTARHVLSTNIHKKMDDVQLSESINAILSFGMINHVRDELKTNRLEEGYHHDQGLN
jgi:hypothetical protein